MSAKSENNFILIMAGGIGSRFWPASREHLPKQFLDILHTGKTLFQLTFERCRQIVPASNIFIATNLKYKTHVLSQVPDLSETQLLLEPLRNNTAPCIAYAALKFKSLNPNGCFAVMPSDHVILDERMFIDKIKLAFSFAKKNEALITFGISPSRPDTGYGYIECGERIDAHPGDENRIIKVVSFKEKPNLPKAKEYLESGRYLWNGGIFIWSIDSVMKAFRKYSPQILKTLSADSGKINSKDEQEYINSVYPETESISVDYALMERSDKVYTIPADIGWSDLGTWNSLYNYLEKDDNSNIVHAEHNILNECKGCFVRSGTEKLVLIKGLEDYIIIDEKDVLLIFPRTKEQEIKALRKNIKETQYL